MGRRSNKRQRKGSRRKVEREYQTMVRSLPDDERRPIPGYEGLYEITRQGDVFSVRAGRFIKHGVSLDGSPYIEFTINNQPHRRNIRETVIVVFGDDGMV
jgi:hypothetical protein